MRDDNQRQEWLKRKRGTLQHLKEKAALYSPAEVPTHLLTEIDILEEEIARLEQGNDGAQLHSARPIVGKSKLKPVAIIAASIVLVAVLVYVLVTSYPPVPVTIYIMGITAPATSGLTDTPIPTTDTPVPSTATPVLTPNTPAPTDTPTATGTVTPMPSSTPTASLTTTPTDTATSTDTATPTPVPSTHTPTPSPLPDMVYVPAGEFIMGSDPRKDEYAQDDEQPVRTVYLDAFYIDKYEVTNAQYRACVEAGACSQPRNTDWYNDPTRAMHPVVHVDWNQANDYCQWSGKRLPTEAEWEKTARGTDGWMWPWGDSFDAEKVNSWESGGSTTPVDWYANGASVFGVLNMAGNVAEWTADWYGSDYYHSASVSNPQGPASGRLRVARGGSWRWNQEGMRPADRNAFSPDTNSHDVGFRCARDAE